MNDYDKTNLEVNACIDDIDSYYYQLDKVRYAKTIGENNIIKTEDIKKFDLNDDPIMNLELNKILKYI